MVVRWLSLAGWLESAVKILQDNTKSFNRRGETKFNHKFKSLVFEKIVCPFETI